MKSARLFLLPGLALILLTLAFPLPGQGQLFIGKLLELLDEAKDEAQHFPDPHPSPTHELQYQAIPWLDGSDKTYFPPPVSGS
jgi:hypothetical protein